MRQNKVKKNLNVLTETQGFFLKFCFYLPPSQGEEFQTLIKFFQKHDLHVERLQKKKHLSPFDSSLKNANFFAQSGHLLTQREFEELAFFLFRHVTITALFYQNQIWSRSRLDKLKTTHVVVPRIINSVNRFQKHLQKIYF